MANVAVVRRIQRMHVMRGKLDTRRCFANQAPLLPWATHLLERCIDIMAKPRSRVSAADAAIGGGWLLTSIMLTTTMLINNSAQFSYLQ